MVSDWVTINTLRRAVESPNFQRVGRLRILYAVGWWGGGTCWVPGWPFALHRSLHPALMEPHSPQQGFSFCSSGRHIPRLWHGWTHDSQLIVGNFRGLKNVAVLLSSSRAQEQTCRSLPKTLTVPKAITQSKFWWWLLWLFLISAWI